MFREYINSPIGPIEIICDERFLLSVSFVKKANKKEAPNKLTEQTNRQLYEYFQGKRTKFDIPLKLEGTEFQTKVWTELRKIPYGQLKTYGSLAKSIDRPSASRAVGGANNRNKIGIIIPCHRVVGVGGKLVGYAPGLKYKKFLLKLEGSLEE